ncbi:type VII secretion-associated serine protease mycosin [Verrucosispora sp. WMMD573]|uniref:type VII secretion-associated serine protease mycosin n=1 Tax=Verrucosispora sp. WMMD573 TaxID=3015149 RepID=UPI00248B5139|nr:type VII secretion-associated serine protease mycosin [Verrucosispora sp. WMMD573]WBB57412.1 type VII secretion-associated serine protease mycosin [Verrucosispora sp. WMMD573]
MFILPLAPPTAAHSRQTPDDPDRVRTDQWHLPYLRVQDVHEETQGEGVTVAVVDTGVDPHPDLRGNLLPGTDLLEGGGRDGRRDITGHGTGMAGIIAAHGRSANTGALGIAPEAKILPVRCLNSELEGNVDCLASAIEYSIRAGADIISISAGGGASPQLLRALGAARSSDVVIVAAAGNQPRNSDVPYPAASDDVIAVGGIDRRGSIAEISTIGSSVDIAAPAVDIFSTSIRSRYRKGTGTSGAAAIVAGAAALVRAKYPYLPADEVAHRLTATAIDKGPPGRDDQYGYGVIDLVAALTADVPPRGFGPVPTDGPDAAGPTTAGADGPPADEGSAATVRGLVTLGVLVAAGGAWALAIRHRRRSDDPPPRITR